MAGFETPARVVLLFLFSEGTHRRLAIFGVGNRDLKHVPVERVVLEWNSIGENK